MADSVRLVMQSLTLNLSPDPAPNRAAPFAQCP